MISASMRRKLELRDPYCWHCGENTDLVLHHRKNRQMGGSKLLDRYDNLIRVCQQYNFLMESDAATASDSKERGHKLASWQAFNEPLYDAAAGQWYVLEERGEKTPIEPPSFLI